MSKLLCVADHSQPVCCKCGNLLPPRKGCNTRRLPRRRPGLIHHYCSRRCSGLARRTITVYETPAGKRYHYMRFPEHPRANKGGNIPVHTWVAEQKLGRFLRDYEVAHHLDGNGENNDPENLLVVPASVNRWLGPMVMS